jgi:hypothetical protein
MAGMSRVARLLLVSSLSSIGLGLVACQRETAPVARPAVSAAAAASAAASFVPAAASYPESAAASAPARGAPDDDKVSLMQEAFPEWRSDQPYVWYVPEADPKGHETTSVAISPELVVSIDETHRVLVVRGTISDDDGRLGGGHAEPGNLGAYWFERRDDRWFVTHRRDSILWSGFMGEIGTVKPVESVDTLHAVSIENGSCWQGFCAGYLFIADFDREHAKLLVDGLRVASTSTGGTPGCTEALAGKKADPHGTLTELGPDNCFDVDGKWRFQARGGAERPDLVVAYSGAELVKDGGGNVAKPVSGTLVLRYANGEYKPASGVNPTHDF